MALLRRQIQKRLQSANKSQRKNSAAADACKALPKVSRPDCQKQQKRRKSRKVGKRDGKRRSFAVWQRIKRVKKRKTTQKTSPKKREAESRKMLILRKTCFVPIDFSRGRVCEAGLPIDEKIFDGVTDKVIDIFFEEARKGLNNFIQKKLDEMPSMRN